MYVKYVKFENNCEGGNGWGEEKNHVWKLVSQVRNIALFAGSTNATRLIKPIAS